MTTCAGASLLQEPGLSLVAYYGNKDDNLSTLIRKLQTLTSRMLGDAFKPRPQEDVHATIIGLFDPTLRRVAGFGGPPESKALVAYLAHVHDVLGEARPSLRLGGYDEGQHYAFSSRGEHLAQRSMSVTSDQVLVIGWPWLQSGGPVPLLHELRRDAENYDMRHKYLRSPEAFDADAYLVLGDIEPPGVGPQQQLDLRRAGRDFMRAHLTGCTLGPSDLWVVAHRDQRLPHALSHAWPLVDFDEAAAASWSSNVPQLPS